VTEEQIQKDTEDKMMRAVEAAQKDFGTIRSGRANPSLLESVKIDYYGTMTSINQVGTVTAPEPRLLVISPWDKSIIPQIEKAISSSDLGLVPASDGNVVRLQIPYLTEERRKEMIRLLHEKAEAGRIEVRRRRREANDLTKDLVKKGEMSADDATRCQEKVQEVTDRYVQEIDKLQLAKEDELMEV
jgi:ribosome recycling factor